MTATSIATAATLTVGELESALRACGVEYVSAALLPGRVALVARIRDTAGEPVSVTGEASTLDGAALDALRKVGGR